MEAPGREGAERMRAEEWRRLVQKAAAGRTVREIRVRAGRPVFLLTDCGEQMLFSDGTLRYGNNQMASVVPVLADQALIKELMEIFSRHSLYAYEEELRQGFLTIEGGHRVGIAGKAVVLNREIHTIREISGMNIRIVHEIKGCGDFVLPFLFFNGEFLDTLILSPPGAGKTTLLKLLLGDEQPNSGAITINDQNINTLQQQRSSIISVLDQQPHLFASSVANNLRLGNLAATDEELWHVLKQVALSDLVGSLPEGLETPMTEMGNRFSGGEQQRFALARVLLQDTPIVVLDEPTVALDPITELNVLKTIFDALSDRTIIWVTHHLTGIEFVNDVIFIENKKISMQGAPEQLMTTEPRFKKLLQMDHGSLTDI